MSCLCSQQISCCSGSYKLPQCSLSHGCRSCVLSVSVGICWSLHCVLLGFSVMVSICQKERLLCCGVVAALIQGLPHKEVLGFRARAQVLEILFRSSCFWEEPMSRIMPVTKHESLTLSHAPSPGIWLLNSPVDRKLDGLWEYVSCLLKLSKYFLLLAKNKIKIDFYLIPNL